MTHRRQNFMGGAAILAGAVAVTKLLGALYKIPLGNLLDREGMAHFYAAYNIYSLLLVLSTAGLPVALSRMVSRAAAQRRYGAVRRCLHSPASSRISCSRSKLSSSKTRSAFQVSCS